MSPGPKDLFALLLWKAQRDPLSTDQDVSLSLRPHQNSNRLWPLTTRSNIMWRPHISKHFETAPPLPPQPSVAPDKESLSHKDNTIGKQECMSWEKEGSFGGSEEEGGGRRDGGGDKSLDAGVEQPLTGLYGLWLSGRVCSAVIQGLKRSSGVTAFSLSPSPLWCKESRPGSKTLISLGRDSDTHTPTHSHTERWLRAFCCQVLVHWFLWLLKDNERAASQTGSHSATVCQPIT